MKLFREEVSEYRKARLHGEIIFSQPASTRIMVIVLFAIIAIAGTWVALGSYARIERVQGILVTDKPSAKVFAEAPGIITQLYVSEGDPVKKGDRIAIVNLDRRLNSGEAVATRSLNTLAVRHELAKEQISASKQRTAADLQRLNSLILSAEQQVVDLQEQINLQQQLVASNQQLFDQMSAVVERGFVSKVEYERRRQALLSSQQQLSSLKQQLSIRNSEARQARAQILATAADSKQSSIAIEAALQGILQQHIQLEGQQEYVIIAPISGRVTALQTAVGRSVTQNVPLLLIVADGTKLIAELYAPTRAIGFVKPGQETRLLYDAFPYQRFGSFGGVIESISRTAIDPRETEVPIKLEEAVYRITVRPEEQKLGGFGENINLQPGMTLHANVVLERQSFLSWLLSPLTAVLNRSR